MSKTAKELLLNFRNPMFLIALAFIIYMPFHVLIVQSASLLTGGIEAWKASKDILIVGISPILLLVAHRRGLFADQLFRRLAILGVLYGLLHLLYVAFDHSDDTYSAIVGSVYNVRLFSFLLLGYIVGSSREGRKYLKVLLTVAVVVASIAALFGVAQYFLPKDLLENVGYSIDRGVKPMFFIDDKPDLPRVMSTLKDPNSLAAYLILPILACGMALFRPRTNPELFYRPFRQGTLASMFAVQVMAFGLTFSRGALLGMILSIATILYIVTGQKTLIILKKLVLPILLLIALCSLLIALSWNSYTFQNLVFHADQSTVLADPNELRVSLTADAVDAVVSEPLGYGPGSAGLVSINNPKGGILTENYYIQIAHEVGWAGLVIFLSSLLLIGYRLAKQSRNSPTALLLLASLVAYLFYSLLIHLWSNEAVALQWWLLTGTVLGTALKPKTSN